MIFWLGGREERASPEPRPETALALAAIGVRSNLVAFSPDGVAVITGSNGSISLWDVKSGAALKAVNQEGHPDSAMSVAFSSDGRRRDRRCRLGI